MKVLFCGDISPTEDTGRLFGTGEIQALFSDTAELFKQCDFSVVNLECALTEHDTPINKIGPALKAPPATAQTLKELGVTHCSLCNNHFFDFGSKGAMDSIAALEAAGLPYTGFGKNEADSRKDLLIEKDGERIAVIAVCEHEYSYALEDRMGCRPFDEFETPFDVRAAKEKYDRVVVLYHGGKEQCAFPSPRLRKACLAMAKSGADLILCQHSHCIGCYEQFEGSHILYGQGNFHFVREKRSDLYGWNEGFGIFYDTDTHSVEFVPIVKNDNAGIRLASAQEKEEILAAFADRNAMLADGRWMDGWVEFCESMREKYTQAVERAGNPEFGQKGIQKFAHYLDCEAHQDVWRTLFPTYNRTNEK